MTTLLDDLTRRPADIGNDCGLVVIKQGLIDAGRFNRIEPRAKSRGGFLSVDERPIGAD
jgi:hypothetical protein